MTKLVEKNLKDSIFFTGCVFKVHLSSLLQFWFGFIFYLISVKAARMSLLIWMISVLIPAVFEHLLASVTTTTGKLFTCGSFSSHKMKNKIKMSWDDYFPQVLKFLLSMIVMNEKQK